MLGVSSASPATARPIQRELLRPARGEGGDPQRADELDGDRDAQRDPGDGAVEAHVHRADDTAEQQQHPDMAPRVLPDLAPRRNE